MVRIEDSHCLPSMLIYCRTNVLPLRVSTACLNFERPPSAWENSESKTRRSTLCRLYVWRMLRRMLGKPATDDQNLQWDNFRAKAKCWRDSKHDCTEFNLLCHSFLFSWWSVLIVLCIFCHINLQPTQVQINRYKWSYL